MAPLSSTRGHTRVAGARGAKGQTGRTASVGEGGGEAAVGWEGVPGAQPDTTFSPTVHLQTRAQPVDLSFLIWTTGRGRSHPASPATARAPNATWGALSPGKRGRCRSRMGPLPPGGPRYRVLLHTGPPPPTSPSDRRARNYGSLSEGFPGHLRPHFYSRAGAQLHSTPPPDLRPHPAFPSSPYRAPKTQSPHVLRASPSSSS